MITLEMQGQDEMLAKLSKIADKSTRASILDDSGSYLLSKVQERFEQEEGPDGEAWEKSARAKEDGGKTLSDSRMLHDSYTYESSADHVAVGSNRIYAAIHHFGGEIVPKSKDALYFWVGGHFIKTQKVVMPARPVLGFTDDDHAEFNAIVNDHWKAVVQ